MQIKRAAQKNIQGRGKASGWGNKRKKINGFPTRGGFIGPTICQKGENVFRISENVSQEKCPRRKAGKSYMGIAVFPEKENGPATNQNVQSPQSTPQTPWWVRIEWEWGKKTMKNRKEKTDCGGGIKGC